MKIKSRLYITIIKILSQHKKWLDIRHMFTLAWMVVGLIRSEKISPTAWIPHVESKAQYAQSTQRRFLRWLCNERIEVYTLYGPLIQQALTEWGNNTLYLALDTSRLFDDYCLIRISVVFRGHAIPIVWKVIEHKSNTVAYDVYNELLDNTAKLLPKGVRAVLTLYNMMIVSREPAICETYELSHSIYEGIINTESNSHSGESSRTFCQSIISFFTSWNPAMRNSLLK